MKILAPSSDIILFACFPQEIAQGTYRTAESGIMIVMKNTTGVEERIVPSYG
jgi:hypothetical protein